MAPSVSAVLTTLRRAMHHYRLLALVKSAGTVCLFPILASAPGSITSKGFAMLLLAAYGWFTFRDIRVQFRHIGQLRLESRFVEQDLDGVQLVHCLSLEQHIWSSSLVLEGLRGVQAHPLPRLLEPEDRIERLKLHFRRAFADMRWDHVKFDWLLPLLTAGVFLPGALSGPSSPVTLAAALGVGLFALLGLCELAAIALRRTIRGRYERLEHALGTWALEAKLYNVIFDRRKLYAHTLLYEARPWFGADDER